MTNDDDDHDDDDHDHDHDHGDAGAGAGGDNENDDNLIWHHGAVSLWVLVRVQLTSKNFILPVAETLAACVQ